MKKIKAIDNKTEQSKTQSDLDRQTAKMSELTSGNVSKYKFLISEDILLEKDLIKKVARIKTFEYSPLGNELENQTDN